MKKILFLPVLFMLLAAQLYAQFGRLSPADSIRRDSINRLTQADYMQMLGQLHITNVRPGVNGNDPKSPDAANYDEAKANPYPDLPDPLTLKSGKKVNNASVWWKQRRPEIVEDFDREIYGRLPQNIPAVHWIVLKDTLEMVSNVQVHTRKLKGHVDNSSYPAVDVNIDLTVSTPVAAQSPVPLVIEFGFIFPPGFRMPAPPPTAGTPAPSWQEQCIRRGWGYAELIPTSIQADNGAGLRAGIIGLVNHGQWRKPDDWGALRAWAWGLSRVIDFFETDKLVDAKNLMLEGHSRYGKAALVALAYEPRLLTAFVSSSGEGGAKLHRRNAGEVVENVASSGEYHWMAGNFIRYAGPLHWNDLPVDSHELIALCAPRPVFISAGDKGDGWVDARGMFMAADAAGPVYTLLGLHDLGSHEFPAVETGLLTGDIAYRQHRAGHTAGPNWPFFLDFAARYLRTTKNNTANK